MEREVELDAVEAPGVVLPGSLHLHETLFEPVDLRVARSTDRRLAGPALEGLSHLVDLLQVARRQRRDDASASWKLDDQALPRQLAHRLSNRTTARPIAL